MKNGLYFGCLYRENHTDNICKLIGVADSFYGLNSIAFFSYLTDVKLLYLPVEEFKSLFTLKNKL